MTIESNTDKQKLTGELNAAKQQVAMLQNRINRMEMMFLQHAAGLASESLPPSVVRSISAVNGIESDLSSSLLQVENMDLDDSNHGKRNKLSSSPDTGSNGLRTAFDNGVEASEQVDYNEDHLMMEEAVARHVSDGKLMNSEEIIEILAMARKTKEGRPSRARSEEEIRAWALSSKLKEALELGNEILDEKYYLEDMSKKASFSMRSDADSVSSSAKQDSSRKASDLDIENSVRRFLAYASIPEPEGSSVSVLVQYFDQLVSQLMPTAESHEDRVRIFEYLRSLMYSNLNVHIFPVGSFLSRTYLPLGDMDITAFFLHQDDESWFVRVNEILCMTAFGGSGYYTLASLPGQPNSIDLISEADPSSRSRFTLNNVSFVNADTKIIKSSINGVSVDLSANQIGALYLQIFLETINTFVGQDNLFKRSILLIKAWCTYESHKYSRGAGSVAGSIDGRLSTSSLNTMIIWVFNVYGTKITTPLHALYHFLYFFSTFDWNKYAISISGPLSAVDLSPVAYPFDADIDYYFPEHIINDCKDRYADAREAFILNALAPYLPRPEKHPPAVTSTADSAPTVAAEDAGQANAALSPELLEVKNMIADSWIAHAAFDDTTAFYKRGLMNVMNPVAPKNNFSRTVDSFGYRAIQHAFYDGYQALRMLIGRVDSLTHVNSEQVSLVQHLMNSSIDNIAKDAIHRHSEGLLYDHAKENDVITSVVELMMNTCVNVIVPLLRGTHAIASGRRVTPLTSSSTSPAMSSHMTNAVNSSSAKDILSNSPEDTEVSPSLCCSRIFSKVTDGSINLVFTKLCGDDTWV
jgi:hypothetical protein